MQRSDLEKLSKEELIELILTMYDRFQIKIVKLETHINQNSKNSSTPQSKDPPWKKPQTLQPKTGKQPGAQKGHKRHGLKITHPPNQTIQHKPTTCKHCQTNLTQTTTTAQKQTPDTKSTYKYKPY